MADGYGELDTLLVQIHGLRERVPTHQSIHELGNSAPAIDVDGKVGRVLYREDDKYVVHLFDAGFASIAADHLREYVPPKPEDGGFDIAWPSASDLDTLQGAGFDMASVVAEKGWCLVQMIADDDTRKDATKQAQSKARAEGSTLKQEFLPDYLGRGGSGKTVFLDTKFEDLEGEDYQKDPLTFFDQNLTDMATVCEPSTWDLMGFHSFERTQGLAWVSATSKKEESMITHESLTEEDVEDGTLETYVRRLRRRKLCFQYFIENPGGELLLHFREDLGKDIVRVPLTANKVLVYRPDLVNFTYMPKGGESLVLSSWVLEEQQKIEVNDIQGELMLKAELHGIKDGQPHPWGDRIHINAIMSRLPGGGYYPHCYWSLLLEGTDGMVEIPHQRFDTDVYCTREGEPRIPGKIYAAHGGFCTHDQIFGFDNEFFGITHAEAKFMCPGQRVVLEDGYTVVFRAGHSKKSLNGRKMGCFLGDTGSDWTPFQQEDYDANHKATKGAWLAKGGISQFAVTGGSNAVTAARLNHCLNMVGPTSTADTACSSSLVATGVGCGFLRARNLDARLEFMSGRLTECIAGGICTQIGPGSYIAMCGLNMISTYGRCFTFDESGDGYARGEGCGLMYLKGSADQEDILNQAACLMGCAINQDGRSASMTAPNGPAQQVCILASLRESGYVASDIDLAECHGTGTALGDPIEVGALRAVMEPRDAALATTSSKSNIGHLEGGAGIAGLLKCIVMLKAGVCPPNAHCRQLNPHLHVAGFPCFFDTEAIDNNLNAGLTGVSSFGFGGTNGRSDIWGQARFGVRASGEMDISKIHQITATCPITFGPIDHLTGEPANTVVGTKYKADVLRDEFADYSVSRYAYTGGFRYRRNDTDEDEDEDLIGDLPFICGSWSGYTELQEMENEGEGWYSTTVVLGEGRYELFGICLNKDPETSIYPAIDKAHQKIWVEGPSPNPDNKKWIIDGRHTEVSAGSAFKIHFKWSLKRMQVLWEEVEESQAANALSFQHVYYISPSTTKYNCLSMSKGSEDGTWEGSITIGISGQEDFQLLRDKDINQAIYPAHASPEAAARGPDDMGKGKRFVVKGSRGDVIGIKLTIVDAHIEVTVNPNSDCEQTWESEEGWERHAYFIAGTFSRWKPLPMEFDPMNPGFATFRGSVGQIFYPDFYSFAEAFQIYVEGDERFAYYPDAPLSESGASVIRGPDGDGEGKHFLIKAPAPDMHFEVLLDLTADDRRRTVTWKFIDPSALEDDDGE